MYSIFIKMKNGLKEALVELQRSIEEYREIVKEGN